MKKENISYVNAVIFSEDGKSLVFLKKLSGPPFLIGKYNFIGGKQEVGETHLDAIIREVKEEAGIEVSPERFYSIDYREFEKDGRFYKLENFAAVVSPEVLKQSRTVEHEPVYHMPFTQLIDMMKEDKEAFNYDFKTLLIMALDNVPEKFKNPVFSQMSYNLYVVDKENTQGLKLN